MNIDPWINDRRGKYIDEDGVWGSQCVDLAVNFVKWLWPNISRSVVLPNGNAKDLFARANSTYFEKIPNDRNNPSQLPKRGDIAIFGATSTNADGHILIVLSANASGIQAFQQDGSIDKNRDGNADGVAYEVFRPWSKSPCIGWLRPKITNQPATQPQQGGSAVNDKFINEAEVKPFYMTLRGNEASLQERQGWVGRPKIEFITSANTHQEAKNSATERENMKNEIAKTLKPKITELETLVGKKNTRIGELEDTLRNTPASPAGGSTATEEDKADAQRFRTFKLVIKDLVS